TQTGERRRHQGIADRRHAPYKQNSRDAQADSYERRDEQARRKQQSPGNHQHWFAETLDELSNQPALNNRRDNPDKGEDPANVPGVISKPEQHKQRKYGGHDREG